ncbi:MAG: hypothetical protein QOC99_3088 [Acidobacteriota bacterium]|jgi:hypothetical protein|nr:hypothetical protein [Acidobacteriota bacterium]
MADYRDKLGEWSEAARRKARELDEKYNVRERVEEGARVAGEAARRGADVVKTGAERARTEAERIGEDFDLNEHAQDARERAEGAREQAGRAAEEAARLAREVGGRVREAGQKAGERAGDVLGGAKKYYKGAARAAGMGVRVAGISVRATRLTTASSAGLFRAYEWARQNPKQAIVVTLSLAAGVRAGASFPGLDGLLLGAHPHWFTHSALPVWAVRKVGKKFEDYLRERERLVAAGELDEAERKRVEFERKMVRYVGAPLLGAFSCAAGVAMWAQILQPGPIVGAPISWLLGGNPVLDGIWLFGNGIICFQQGYKFFMIALKDQEDVHRIVREIKGLLPSAATA